MMVSARGGRFVDRCCGTSGRTGAIRAGPWRRREGLTGFGLGLGSTMFMATATMAPVAKNVKPDESKPEQKAGPVVGNPCHDTAFRSLAAM